MSRMRASIQLRGAGQMLQMLYVSGASRPMSEDDLQNILLTSRKNNLRDGITGMLLWADGVFIQILEGEPAAVRSLVSRIQRDARHRNIMVVHEQSSEKRMFTQWSMGFKILDANRSSDKKLFQISRAALPDRITDDEGGLFLETVLAFSGDFMSAIEPSQRRAQA